MGRDRALARINEEYLKNRTVNEPEIPPMKRLIARFLLTADTRKMTAPFHNRIRKVCPLMAATLILPALAISFAVPTFAQQKDAQAPEKKKITGTNKWGPHISRTVVPPGPGDDPKHELVVLQISRATTTSPDPDDDGTEIIAYEQDDEVAGTGTQRGYYVRLHKNGDRDYGTYRRNA
jgi:hypothetical protein